MQSRAWKMDPPPSSSLSWSKGFPCSQERVFTSLEAFGGVFFPLFFYFLFLAAVGLRTATTSF